MMDITKNIIATVRQVLTDIFYPNDFDESISKISPADGESEHKKIGQPRSNEQMKI